MLFHITHHHDENTCLAHDQEAAGATFGAVLESLEANVDQVMGAWVDPSVHDFFFVIEADDSKKYSQDSGLSSQLALLRFVRSPP